MKHKAKKETYSEKIGAQNDFVITEAYRSARTNIDFSVIKNECKTIIFTSPVQGEGKTTSSINIAGAFSRKLDTKVLIIDCDLRKPRVSKALNIKHPKGLTDYLCKSISIDEIVVKTDIEGLYAIFSGTIPPNPAELLGSVRMKELVSELKEQFDYIIIDTPPTTIVSDVLSVCDLADGVVIVVRENQTNFKDIELAIEALNSANIKILGFILNDTQKRSKAKYSLKTKYRYRYSYSYGSSTYYSEQKNTGGDI